MEKETVNEGGNSQWKRKQSMKEGTVNGKGNRTRRCPRRPSPPPQPGAPTLISRYLVPNLHKSDSLDNGK